MKASSISRRLMGALDKLTQLADIRSGAQFREAGIWPVSGKESRPPGRLSGCGPRVDRFVDFPLPGLPGRAEAVFQLEAEPEFGEVPRCRASAGRYRW